MAKLFPPILLWIARFICRKSSASSGSSCPRVPRPASSPPPAGGGLSFAVLQAALHPRSALPPPRRSGLRFPTPVGHGRGLASRPGCAGPGEGVGSPCLRPASPTPGERGTMFLPPPRQPAAARHRSRLSLSASGSSIPTQAGTPRPKHSCHILRRQPARLAPRRITPRHFSAFFADRGAATTPERRNRSLPGETRLTKGFCPFPPPIRQ